MEGAMHLSGTMLVDKILLVKNCVDHCDNL